MRFVLVLCLSGCAHTRIAAREIPQEAQRLASLAAYSTTFSIECPIDEIVGHQYLFLVLPFGRISLEDASEHLSRSLIISLAQRGFAARRVPPDNARVKIVCTDLSLSAYDYLFVRRIVASANWTVETKINGQQVGPALKQKSERGSFRAFAFHRQLEHVWNQMLVEAAETMSKAPVWQMSLTKHEHTK